MTENTLELRERPTAQSESPAPCIATSPARDPTPGTAAQSEAAATRRIETSTAPIPTPGTAVQSEAAATRRIETSTAPIPTPATDNGVEEHAMLQAARFARLDLALSTAYMLWWGYLVFGEFVLAGVPEWFGWFVVATLGGASYFTLERRVAAYLPERSRRERVRNWVLAILACGVILIASLMLGIILP
ncbi:MAG TPA: hypothetical protein VKP30_05980, partial [Polyangiaceae bacterium]|nr:hypothetical protein [Polyangiaceae bacterium]